MPHNSLYLKSMSGISAQTLLEDPFLIQQYSTPISERSLFGKWVCAFRHSQTTRLCSTSMILGFSTVMVFCGGVIRLSMVWSKCLTSYANEVRSPHQKFRRDFLDPYHGQGKKLVFVTNNATKSRKSYKKKFDQLGLDVHVVRVQSMLCVPLNM